MCVCVGGGGDRAGEGGYQTLYCQHQNDCVQLDSGESRFKVSLTVRVNCSRKRLSINHPSVLMEEESLSGIELLSCCFASTEATYGFLGTAVWTQ